MHYLSQYTTQNISTQTHTPVQYIPEMCQSAITSNPDCNCIVTRGGVYDEILPEPEGNPEGGARGISNIFQYWLVELANIFQYWLVEDSAMAALKLH